MRFAPLLRLTTLASALFFLNSCGAPSVSMEPSVAPMMVSPSMSGSSQYRSTKALNRNSLSTKKRQLVKKGSLNLDTEKVRQTGETIENIVIQKGGQVVSMSERDDDSKYANFGVYVPASELVSTMDEISELGNVTYRKISAEDVTKSMIRFKTKLQNLKQRRSRILSLYRASKSVTDKLELELRLSELESEIYEMEESIRQMQKIANFSRLDISLTQSSIRGPLGVISDSGSWLVRKLFTIRE